MGSGSSLTRGLSGVGGGALLGAQIGSMVPGVGTVLGPIGGAMISGLPSLFGGRCAENSKRTAAQSSEGGTGRRLIAKQQKTKRDQDDGDQCRAAA
jgi:hypothetical protein